MNPKLLDNVPPLSLAKQSSQKPMFWIANILRYIGYVLCVFTFIYLVALIYYRHPIADYVNPAICMFFGLGLQFIAYQLLPKVAQHDDGRTVTKHL